MSSDKHLFGAVCIAIEAGIPVLWWGAPGIGKTFRIRGYGRATKRHTEVVIASIHPPEDFSGLPVRDGDRARYLPPEWAVRLLEAGGGLLFFDEISTAAPASQAALLRVVLEKAVGQLQLPESVAIVIRTEDLSIDCIAKSGSILSNGIEHRLDIRWRAGDHPQDFASGGLLL